MWVALHIFELFCPKARNASSLVAQPKTDLTQSGHSRSLKVIYFGVSEEPIMENIAQYNKFGPRREVSEYIAGEICENRHFR